MANDRFFDVMAPLNIAEAITLCGASLLIDAKGKVASASSLAGENLSDCVVFVSDKKAAKELAAKKIALCLTTKELSNDIRANGPIGAIAIMDNPKHGFGLIAGRLYREKRVAPGLGGISPDAKISTDAEIHSCAIIAQGAQIGAGARVGAFSIIGPGVVIGAGTEVGAHAEISHTIVGANCRIGAGARVGGPGFGFAETAQGPIRMPQLGSVEIGDNVEVGSNSSIDRGALDNTVIGRGTKIDNLVHIGHNVVIGAHCVIAGLTGFAGSAQIGAGVLIGGHVAVADHIMIGDGAKIAGKSGVMRHVPAGEVWGGYPAQPMKTFLRGAIMAAKNTKKNVK